MKTNNENALKHTIYKYFVERGGGGGGGVGIVRIFIVFN